MRRVINVNYTSVICEVTHTGNIEHLACSSSYAEAVADFLAKNGAMVVGVKNDFPSKVSVDRTVCFFGGDSYNLNQCEDIFDWARDSSVYDFTYYYDKVVFHTQNGIIAAYRDDINNTIKL